jgi:hypothetical protein
MSNFARSVDCLTNRYGSVRDSNSQRIRGTGKTFTEDGRVSIQDNCVRLTATAINANYGAP